MVSKIIFIFLGFIILLSNSSSTNELTCIDCYANNQNDHCINESFSKSECCIEDKEACLKRNKYCTKNIKKSVYKVFTCPMASCPNNNKLRNVTHSNFEQVIYS